MYRRALLLTALLGACSNAPTGAKAPDGGLPIDGAVEGYQLPPQCAGAAVPPATLECTGLYTDVPAKLLAPGVQPYAPAVPLWSDGAEKQRWVSLPPGTTIDTANPSEWVFPVGTKFWKQFGAEGHRVETRLWWKVRADRWVNATYAWNADETAAVQSGGGDVPFGSGTYHIPTQDECEKCHRGRNEHILGFEAVELGLPGATGMTLSDLVAQGRLTVPPPTTLSIGDDGTGAAAPALGWLHANCGITCHNGNSNALAFPSGLRFRLDPTQLDGRPSSDFDARRTGIGVAVHATNWSGQTRIVPGDPSQSLLYFLISHRGAGMQMPPFATRVVDDANVAVVGRWIAAMPRLPMPDAGVADAGIDSAPDASVLADMALPEPDVAPAAPDLTAAPDAGVEAEPDAAVDAAAPDAPVMEDVAATVDTADPDAGTPDAAGE
jgi:hypothetical protein